MNEVWTRFEGQVVNGVFPLRRLLRVSDHSAVFLTEFKTQDLSDAALKLVPAAPDLAPAQLARWSQAAALSHAHLIRLLETGRCRIEDLEFLYVVMEYAEQTLSQILPQRPLTADEVMQMLLPTTSCLAFLHSKNLVHAQLKPSNILVVNDQLKLASDTIRPAGESAATVSEFSAYDPPEAIDGSFSTAGDIWGLGITLVEALTGQLPTWPSGKSAAAIFGAVLPATLEKIARQCLDPNPANRPAAAELQAELNPAPPVQRAPPLQSHASEPEQLELIPKPRIREASVSASSRAVRTQRPIVPAIAVLLIAVIAVWAALRLLGSHTPLEQAAPSAEAAQSPDTSSAATPSAPPANNSPLVLHEEIPDIPLHARGTIRGHIKIAVRVTVDSSGNVIHEVLESRGPSYYFARLATEAARKWKFVPADNQDNRKWLLRFEFTRDGVTGHAVTLRS